MQRRLLPRRSLPVVAVLVTWCAGMLPAAEADHAPVTIDALIALARTHAPTADRITAEQALATAAVREAGAWRNPELELSGGRARFREEDGTAGIGSVAIRQPLPSPWRRSAELAAARAGIPQAATAAAIAWLELELAVRAAAADHTAADEALVLAEAAAQAAATMRAAVEARTRAGEAGQAELARARVEESQAQRTVDRRRHAIATTRAALATWCGATLPADPAINDALPARFAALDRDTLVRTACDAGPRLRLLADGQRQRQAELRARRRAWQPDLTIGGGLNREADADSWELTLGIELPLWNRQQGAIDRASAELARGEAELRTLRAEVERAVIAAWGDYERERLQLDALVAVERPAASEARRLTMAAFQGGAATFADLVETQRAELRTGEEALEARRAAMTAWLTLAAMTGNCQPGTKEKP